MQVIRSDPSLGLQEGPEVAQQVFLALADHHERNERVPLHPIEGAYRHAEKGGGLTAAPVEAPEQTIQSVAFEGTDPCEGIVASDDDAQTW